MFAHYHYYCANEARKHALGMVKFGLFLAHVKRVLSEKHKVSCIYCFHFCASICYASACKSK